MIPILYAPDEQDFTSNGLGRLADCRRFEVTEERNGIYECEFEYPVTGPLFSELKYGYYVYATHDESKTPQAFEIYSREATLDGWATFRAWHISYQLNDIIVRPFTASGIADAMSKIPANEITPGPFTFWTDKTTTGDFTLDIPKAARALLGGSQGSLLDVFGKGDYEFDMHAVKLHIDRGADRGVSIRYGKNLKSLDQKLEGGDIVNGVVPFWQSTDGEVVSLDFPIYGEAIAYPVPLITQAGETIQTYSGEDIIAQWANLKVQALDLSSDFDEPPTEAQLADRARAIMASATSYQLEENLEIDFVALWQTEEYKSVAALQRVFLCDTVSIFYEKLGITASAKVIKTVYDTLRERYSSIELGEPKTTLAQQIQKTVTDGVVAEVKKTFPDNSAMQTAIAYATAMIQGGLGGYVVIEPDASGHPEEILIMDTPDKGTAVNAWRWNSGGLGHSSTGYNGPYDDIALTADGKINADLITTGTLDASQVNVENINADNITSGTIDAIDINGSSISGGTIDGTVITSNGTLPNGASGTATMSAGAYNCTSQRTGSSTTGHYAADAIQLTGDDGQGYTAQVDMFADGEYGAQVHLSATGEGDTFIKPGGISTPSLSVDGYNALTMLQGETLWTGTKVTSGTVQLSDSLANYTWLLFVFNTNVDKATEYIKRADFESGNYIKCWSAGSWTNNHWQYNTWVQLTKVDNTTIRVNNGYNDGNWQGGLVAVYGFAHKYS